MIAIYIIPALVILFFLYSIDRFSSENRRLRQNLSDLLKQTPQAGTTIPMAHFNRIVEEKQAAILQLSASLATVETTLAELKSQQQSKSVRLGQISEQVLPFHKEFPYDYKKLKPMFQPIDYLFFGDEEIVFLELKMGTSQLSESQRNIRRLIEQGKVSFKEFRIDEQGVKIK